MSATPASSAMRMRRAENPAPSAERMAKALARAFSLWRDRNYARRRDAIAAIAHSAEYSVELIENSIDALLKPFTSDALKAMAERISTSHAIDRPKTVGFIAAGNVAGAGIHEVAIALMAGARVLIKTASAEPILFAEFARTLAEIDPDAGARIEVLHWSRARTDLTAALIANCDRVVAYGDDATIESLNRRNVIGFGSRVSAALVAPGAIGPSRIDKIAELLARDVALFEQLGCLSLHQVFVVSPDGRAARELAIRMSAALERLAVSMPPARIPLRDAAEIRAVRERARWRAIAGESVELFEGRGLEWTVIFESKADSFKVSPGFRTVHVTGVRDLAEFHSCVAGVSRQIEAMAVVGDDCEIEARAIGIPYVCAPGEMQSPPLDWRHGGGEFLDMVAGAR
ncbi:MAG TPA: acyl-CoA reductase [Candidatus Binatus sp.]|uniref:acyl-CoA reductase n=1 Tax=Candidatus Binatus sp. TaxID=2811406 RepID=UPI002B4A4192|nr:acyl-CoA reductase [Candidatus Binatus sp.]HKN13505.1 acyl-CoA reductase [Candidatus Binatus sp.]